MPKFHFRLATFQKLREAVRDEWQAALNEALRIDDLLAEREGATSREIAAALSRARAGVGPGAVDVDLLIEMQRYDVVLRWQLAQVQKQRQTLAGEIERRRAALVEANRDVRVLEKLHDKQLTRHQEEETVRERKQLDEVAQQRACGRESEEAIAWES
jgi:flagellar protein FliJ